MSETGPEVRQTFEHRKPDDTFGSQPIARTVDGADPGARWAGIIPGRRRQSPLPPPTNPPPGDGGVSPRTTST